MIRRLFLFCLCILLALSLVSCRGERLSPELIVSGMWEGERTLGEGRVYSLSSEKGSDTYLSDGMLLSLYGFDRSLEGLSGGAVCLSPFYYPFELAVFECDKTLTADDIALMFNNRLKLLMKNAALAAPFCDMTVEEYRAYIGDAEVIISGRYVALIISGDPKNARRIFLDLT